MPPTPPPSLPRILWKVLLMQAALFLLLFAPAGRLDWPQAWLLFIGSGLFLLCFALWERAKDPEQMRERGRTAANVKGWDKVIMFLYSLLFFLLFIMAGLDRRFGRPAPPTGAQLASLAGLLLSAALIFWAARTNTYLSRYARIQDDRGHKVIDQGPYRHVRHPMYTGNIILFLCLGPALGSWRAAVVGIAIMALFILRTAMEDRMLREELPGYAEYARRTRWRLVPWIW